MYKSNDGRGNHRADVGKVASIGESESVLERRERLLNKTGSVGKSDADKMEEAMLSAVKEWIRSGGTIAFTR